MKNNKTVFLMVRIEKGVKEHFQELCAKHQTKTSKQIREYILKCIDVGIIE